MKELFKGNENWSVKPNDSKDSNAKLKSVKLVLE